MHIVSLLFHDVYNKAASESGFSGAVADRYKISSAAFDAILATLKTVLENAPVLAPVFAKPSASMVAITFDDGGVSYHRVIADRLEGLGWRGHCFISTDSIGRPGFLGRSELRELDQRGHVIGTHSVTHPTRFSACTPGQMLEEWARSRIVLEDLLGHEIRVASLPGGYMSQAVAHAAREAGVRWLFTSEPRTRIVLHNSCVLAGRYAIRPEHHAAFARSLVERRRAVLWREWLMWNGKKLAKPMLGAAYPRIGEWLASGRSPASDESKGDCA